MVSVTRTENNLFPLQKRGFILKKGFQVMKKIKELPQKEYKYIPLNSNTHK